MGDVDYSIVYCLMMFAMMFVLAACSEMDQQDHREEAAVIHWPASDTSIHTAQSGTLPRAAQSLLAANADLSINWKRIDGITLYEIYPTDAVNLPAVFLLHEHGASKDQYLPEAVTYAQSGYFCILMDLIGYGERPDANAVESIEAAVMATADIDLLLEYYRLSPYADSNHFALYGQSMGGSAVV